MTPPQISTFHLPPKTKIYPQNDALKAMNNLIALETKSNSLDHARKYIEALAPWIKDDQIEYDLEIHSLGVSGYPTLFSKFH